MAKGVDLAEHKIIYFAGRLNSTIYNTFDASIAAIKELSLRHPDVRMVYCGSGAYEKQIRDKAASLPNILFPGEVGAKALALLRKRAFVALLPVERRVDYQNSLSNKFFEYLSSGMPVLSWLDGLPGQARAYLDLIEEVCGVPIDIVSTGPDREDTIVLKHPFLG